MSLSKAFGSSVFGLGNVLRWRADGADRVLAPRFRATRYSANTSVVKSRLPLTAEIH
jgi:hypothetical protein